MPCHFSLLGWRDCIWGFAYLWQHHPWDGIHRPFHCVFILILPWTRMLGLVGYGPSFWLRPNFVSVGGVYFCGWLGHKVGHSRPKQFRLSWSTAQSLLAMMKHIHILEFGSSSFRQRKRRCQHESLFGHRLTSVVSYGNEASSLSRRICVGSILCSSLARDILAAIITHVRSSNHLSRGLV